MHAAALPMSHHMPTVRYIRVRSTTGGSQGCRGIGKKGFRVQKPSDLHKTYMEYQENINGMLRSSVRMIGLRRFPCATFILSPLWIAIVGFRGLVMDVDLLYVGHPLGNQFL